MTKNIKHVLFVCTGNSCRSIMAEAYLKDRIKKTDSSLRDIEVKSAGTLGLGGMPPSPETLIMLKDHGIDGNGYFSKSISPIVLDWADVILVMSPQHKDAILGFDPSAENKIFYLGNFNGETDEYVIPDPIGTSLENYEKCFDLIRKSVEGFIKWIEEDRES